jgi:pantothenate synthetase
MSSRNSYLSPEERKIATILYRALSSSKNMLLHNTNMVLHTFFALYRLLATLVRKRQKSFITRTKCQT